MYYYLCYVCHDKVFTMMAIHRLSIKELFLLKTVYQTHFFRLNFSLAQSKTRTECSAAKLSDYMMGRLLCLKLAGIRDKSVDQMASAVGLVTSPIWSSWIRSEQSM